MRNMGKSHANARPVPVYTETWAAGTERLGATPDSPHSTPSPFLSVENQLRVFLSEDSRGKIHKSNASIALASPALAGWCGLS